MKQKKIGRNDPCHCGSGKKYKRCHGVSPNQQIINNQHLLTPEEINKKLAEMEGIRKQCEQQQGLGHPIISLMYNGYRMIIVGSRIHYSKKWKTFHDFLFDHIKDILGRDWGNTEIKKPFEERHPILQWYDQVCKYQQQTIQNPGEVHSVSTIGVVEAYLRLSYNLYLIAHNVKIQERLIKRLKDKQQFPGAYYETYVAAVFIKAGFDLEFEDETDVTTKHCEFTAKCRKTGNKYSVEAKSRESGKSSSRIGHQLYKALEKKANFKRIVFIDVNVPDNSNDSENIKWLEDALKSLREKEISMTIDGNPAPESYIFVTNHPYQYSLQTSSFRCAVLAEGFKMPDFKSGWVQYSNLREALQIRDKHADMDQIMFSIKRHYEIPSTFDGEIPEFAFDESLASKKLKIGQKYQIPDSNKHEVIGELVDAIVAEDEKSVYGIYKIEDGKTIMATCPLSNNELLAYRKYPDTFFGVYRPACKKANSPLELFDFFHKVYSHTPKVNLLELMRNHQDYERLKQESQKELVVIYCERLVYAAMDSNKTTPC